MKWINIKDKLPILLKWSAHYAIKNSSKMLPTLRNHVVVLVR